MSPAGWNSPDSAFHDNTSHLDVAKLTGVRRVHQSLHQFDANVPGRERMPTDVRTGIASRNGLSCTVADVVHGSGGQGVADLTPVSPTTKSLLDWGNQASNDTGERDPSPTLSPTRGHLPAIARHHFVLNDDYVVTPSQRFSKVCASRDSTTITPALSVKDESWTATT